MRLTNMQLKEMLNRKIAPPIKDPLDFTIQLPPYTKYTLDNGIPVYMISAAEQETMLIDIVFPAGDWYESNPLQANASNHLMKNGTLHHSALEISEAIEFYGAYLNRSSHHDYANYTLHCLEKHVYNLLPTLQEILTKPSFPENELELYRRNMKQRLAVNLQKCDFVANRYIDQYLFGKDHPYGRYATMETYDELKRQTLVDFFSLHYAMENAKIFIAGNLPHDIIEQLNKYFGGTGDKKKKQNSTPDWKIDPAEEKKYRISNDPTSVQGAVRIARPFPNRYHPDFPKMQLLNTIFGGYFGSRLMSNIREEKGYTYGIHSSLYNFRQQSALNIQTEAGKNVCETTIEEVYHEMKRLKKEIIPEEELQLVRNYIIGSILGDLDGAFQVIQRWKNLLLNELDENYFYNQINIFKTTSAEELRELAIKYLNPEDFYELVVI
jgi:zinc protease